VSAIASHVQCMFLHLDNELGSSRNCQMTKILLETSTLFKCPIRQFSMEWIGPQDLATLFDDLKICAKAQDRRILLVSGAFLEDQVTVCALEALVEGFDVHLLCDLISARDHRLKPVLLLRLFQAGAVPSSLRQFLYMWQAAEGDRSAVESFKKLLTEYDINCSGRPR
jgi:hypothetical protein